MITPLLTIVSGPAFGWLSDNVSRKLVLMVRGAANTFFLRDVLLLPDLRRDGGGQRG